VMGWSAVLRADLISLSKSWIFRIWLLLLLMSFFLVPVGMLLTSRSNPMPASVVLAAYLGIFINVWGTVIIVLSASSVSSEADIVADGILSRACTRTQYILAKLSARIIVVGGIYLVGAFAAAYAAWRYGINDVTWMTMLTGIAIVGTSLIMLVSLGVMMSVLFDNTIVSIVGLLLLWYVAGYIFAFAGAEYMSPSGLTASLPQILRDSTSPQVLSCSATPTSLSVVFSKEVNPVPAENVQNYTVEGTDATQYHAQTAAYNESTNTVVLSGYKFKSGKPVTVTVEQITDLAGNVISPGADSAKSKPIPKLKQESTEKNQTAESSVKESEKSTRVVEKKNTNSVVTTKPNGKKNALPRVSRVIATSSSASITFSQDMNPVKVEKPDNYTVESPPGTTVLPKTAAYDPSTRTVLLSGLAFRKGDPVKVSVKNVTDSQGEEINPRANSGTFKDVHNWKYFAGFGIPAILSALLALAWFQRRDL